MTLDEARQHIGHRVTYRRPGRGLREDGMITSVGKYYVFVRYGTFGPKATRPEDLTLLTDVTHGPRTVEA